MAFIPLGGSGKSLGFGYIAVITSPANRGTVKLSFTGNGMASAIVAPTEPTKIASKGIFKPE
jgi:hypothetical protein